MVQINVAQLLKEPVGAMRNYQVDEVVDIAGNARPVRGEVRLVRTDRSILVRGKLETGVELSCSRCLTMFSCPLSVDIEEE